MLEAKQLQCINVQRSSNFKQKAANLRLCSDDGFWGELHFSSFEYRVFLENILLGLVVTKRLEKDKNQQVRSEKANPYNNLRHMMLRSGYLAPI